MSYSKSAQSSDQNSILDELAEIENKIHRRLKQNEVERVSPKFEAWRNPFAYKFGEGGRGAGAKSWSAVSLLVQFGERPGYFGDRVRILVVRDVEKTIKESCWLLIKDTIERLGYDGWEITEKVIRNTKNGSMFVFSKLSDLNVDSLKSFEGFDILFAEEASPIGYDAWNVILPTFRKKTAEIWGVFNRTEELDPVYDLFCIDPRPNSSILHLEPGSVDNPWWNDTNLQIQWDELKKRDPDEAAHQFEGLPRTQKENAIMPRLSVISAMERTDAEETGPVYIGADISRFGEDDTVFAKRRGMKTLDIKKITQRDMRDTDYVAGELWNYAGCSNTFKIGPDKFVDVIFNVDEGYNPGVIDRLKKLGAKNVNSVAFGSSSSDMDVFPNVVSEMWFEFPIDKACLPHDNSLLMELTERRYNYDASGRRIVESKKDYKKRHNGKSPDTADAVLLAYYVKKHRVAVIKNKSIRTLGL